MEVTIRNGTMAWDYVNHVLIRITVTGRARDQPNPMLLFINFPVRLHKIFYH